MEEVGPEPLCRARDSSISMSAWQDCRSWQWLANILPDSVWRKSYVCGSRLRYSSKRSIAQGPAAHRNLVVVAVLAPLERPPPDVKVSFHEAVDTVMMTTHRNNHLSVEERPTQCRNVVNIRRSLIVAPRAADYP